MDERENINFHKLRAQARQKSHPYSRTHYHYDQETDTWVDSAGNKFRLNKSRFREDHLRWDKLYK